MIYYFLLSLACLVLFIFHHWSRGGDLTPYLLAGLTLMAIFPVMNVICASIVLFELGASGEDVILLKGRK